MWKSCVVDGDNLEGAATGFGVVTIGSLKVGHCYGFSEEEALENMESSWKSSLRVMVSYDSNRGFLLVFFNAPVKYLEVTIIMSVAVAVGMVSLQWNQNTVFPM